MMHTLRPADSSSVVKARPEAIFIAWIEMPSLVVPVTLVCQLTPSAVAVTVELTCPETASIPPICSRIAATSSVVKERGAVRRS
jgi:hypothetical protein